MKHQLIYSVEEIFKNYLHPGGQFIIPEYQRGYKWKQQQISRLLQDINHFVYIEGTDMFYCLQNITLVKTGGNSYNVVDGQQRLTTLTLLLSYLGRPDLADGKLSYKVRSSSNEFLQEFILGEQSGMLTDTGGNWEEFLKDIEDTYNKDFNHQDIYYMFTAWHTIKEWVESHIADRTAFLKKVLENVKLIVNVPDTADEQTLFGNLNGGQIHLDGADLVRAILITRLPETDSSSEYNEQEMVLVNEMRIKIGMELDRINTWWTDKKDYFHYFINTVKNSDKNSILFQEDLYPIDSLYKLYVLSKGGREISIEYFEDESCDIKMFYNRLTRLQRTLEDWYSDDILYHLVFYTIHHIGCPFHELYEQWNGSCLSRNDFIRYLKNKIKDNINLWLKEENTAVKELPITEENSTPQNRSDYFAENWYENVHLPQVMILLDIMDSIDDRQNMGRISRLPVQALVKKTEDEKEHIFPQTPRSNKPQDNDIKEIKEYIDYINCNTGENEKKIIFNEKAAEEWEEEQWAEKKNEINARISKIIPINALGNMCLLNKDINTSYGNDFFAKKHLILMKKAKEGTYIRPHVMDAFCKTFLTDKGSGIDYMKSWTTEDIIEREKNIISIICSFLNN